MRGGGIVANVQEDLLRVIAAAEADAPGVRLDPDAFARHVARFTRPGETAATLRLDQLWLACAAAHGDTRAIALIEARHFDRARAAVRGMGDAVADDALQRVRELLFVGTTARGPRIADYAGRGDLAGWIRTTALREAFQLVAPAREVPVREMAGYALPDADPGVELMKQQYGARFKQALGAALAALPAQTRSELRRYYFEGQGLEQIAAADGVAASTISRRLEKARKALYDETRRALATELGVADDEVDSILRLLDSRLDVSRGAVAR